jgi:hypothetical protein
MSDTENSTHVVFDSGQVGRADFFGPGVTETTLGARVFANALARRRADFIGNPDCPTPTATCPTSPPAWPPSAPTRAAVATA